MSRDNAIVKHNKINRPLTNSRSLFQSFTDPASVPSPNHQHYQLNDPKTLHYVASHLTATIERGIIVR